jgi:hypothetical protein
MHEVDVRVGAEPRRERGDRLRRRVRFRRDYEHVWQRVSFEQRERLPNPASAMSSASPCSGVRSPTSSTSGSAASLRCSARAGRRVARRIEEHR